MARCIPNTFFLVFLCFLLLSDGLLLKLKQSWAWGFAAGSYVLIPNITESIIPMFVLAEMGEKIIVLACAYFKSPFHLNSSTRNEICYNFNFNPKHKINSNFFTNQDRFTETSHYAVFLVTETNLRNWTSIQTDSRLRG